MIDVADIRTIYGRINQLRSASALHAALQALDRNTMLLVIGYGMADPEHGGFYEVMARVILDPKS